MSIALNWAHTDPGEPTNPIGIKPVDVNVRVGQRAWMPLMDLWQLTEPTRAGRRNLQQKRRRALANPAGEQLAEEYRKAIDKVPAEALITAIERYEEQLRTNAREYAFRRVVSSWGHILATGGGLYVHMTMPAWQECAIGLLAGAAVLTRWTLRGRRVIKARERRAARRAAVALPTAPVQVHTVMQVEELGSSRATAEANPSSEPEHQPRDLIADIWAQRYEDETGVWCTEENPELLDRLQRDLRMEDAYANTTVKALSECLKALGLEKRQIGKNGKNALGFYWDTQIKRLLEGDNA